MNRAVRGTVLFSTIADYRAFIAVTCWPFPKPLNWCELVNGPENPKELAATRSAIRHHQPIGSRRWREAVAPFAGLTLRERGRPLKQ
jgi:hypothetical protein